MVSLGRMTLLVRDVDETKAFYADAFDFGTIFDEEIRPGFRAVHIGPEGSGGAELWLIRAETTEADARVGRQTAGEPAFVLYTDDLATDLKRLAALDILPIKGREGDAAGSSFAHVRDNSGNELVLIQLSSD